MHIHYQVKNYARLKMVYWKYVRSTKPKPKKITTDTTNIIFEDKLRNTKEIYPHYLPTMRHSSASTSQVSNAPLPLSKYTVATPMSTHLTESFLQETAIERKVTELSTSFGTYCDEKYESDEDHHSSPIPEPTINSSCTHVLSQTSSKVRIYQYREASRNFNTIYTSSLSADHLITSDYFSESESDKHFNIHHDSLPPSTTPLAFTPSITPCVYKMHHTPVHINIHPPLKATRIFDTNNVHHHIVSIYDTLTNTNRSYYDVNIMHVSTTISLCSKPSHPLSTGGATCAHTYCRWAYSVHPDPLVHLIL